MDLMQMLQSQMSDDVLEQLGSRIGADKQQTASAANGIFTSLLSGLASNAASSDGLSSLMAALDRDHDGSVLDDIAGIAGAIMQGQAQSRAANGAGIINHVLGNRAEPVAQQISQKTGLDMNQVMQLMPVLAPIVMGALGKARNSGELSMGDLAAQLMGSAQQAGQQNDMGDLVGSLLGNVLSGQSQGAPAQRGGGLFGQLLGSLLGRK